MLPKSEKMNERGVQLATFQQRLAEGEPMRQRKYSGREVDNTDWEAADHLASFICLVKTENVMSNEESFYQERSTFLA